MNSTLRQKTQLKPWAPLHPTTYCYILYSSTFFCILPHCIFHHLILQPDTLYTLYSTTSFYTLLHSMIYHLALHPTTYTFYLILLFQHSTTIQYIQLQHLITDNRQENSPVDTLTLLLPYYHPIHTANPVLVHPYRAAR